MKSIRETFLADDGCLMVKADLSQMELRIGLMYCFEPDMIAMANTKPWNYDGHTENAKIIFGTEIVDLPKSEFKFYRNIAKMAVHASWRKMQGKTLAANILKATKGETSFSDKKCQKLINTYLSGMPAIEKVFFPYVENKMYREGLLVTSFGRRYDIQYYRIDDNLKRACYSFYMQAEGADWTNTYIYKPMHEWVWSRHGKALNAQIHDEVVVSLPPEHIYDYCQRIKESDEIRHEMPKGSGNFLSIPIELKIGENLLGKVEFAQLPPRNEFNDIIREEFKWNF